MGDGLHPALQWQAIESHLDTDTDAPSTPQARDNTLAAKADLSPTSSQVNEYADC